MRKNIIMLYYPAVLGSYIYEIFHKSAEIIKSNESAFWDNLDMPLLNFAIVLNMTTAYITVINQIDKDYPMLAFVSDLVEPLLFMCMVVAGEFSPFTYSIGAAFVFNQLIWLMATKRIEWKALIRIIAAFALCIVGISIKWQYYKWIFIAFLYLIAGFCIYQRWYLEVRKTKKN